jgi:hypothetical protein
LCTRRHSIETTVAVRHATGGDPEKPEFHQGWEMIQLNHYWRGEGSPAALGSPFHLSIRVCQPHSIAIDGTAHAIGPTAGDVPCPPTTLWHFPVPAAILQKGPNLNGPLQAKALISLCQTKLKHCFNAPAPLPSLIPSRRRLPPPIRLTAAQVKPHPGSCRQARHPPNLLAVREQRRLTGPRTEGREVSTSAQAATIRRP